MGRIDTSPQARPEIKQPETQPLRRDSIGPAAAPQPTHDNPIDQNKYEIQQLLSEVAAPPLKVGHEEVYTQAAVPKEMNPHKLHAQDPRALEEPAPVLLETYTGTLRVEFIPTLDMDKLGVYWQVLDDMAGILVR